MAIATSTGLLAQEVSQVSRSFKGERVNDVAVWNLGGDQIHEVFLSTVSGKVACYAADTLDPIWEKNVTGDALTAPVIGRFLGTGAPILAFGSSAGEIFFVWPGSGEIISSVKTDMVFSLSPSTAESAAGDSVVLADDQGRIAVANIDPANGKARLLYTVPNTLPGSTAFSVIGGITQPPTCADLDGNGTSEIIVTSDSGVLQVVSLSETGNADTGDIKVDAPKRYHTRLAQQSRATTLVGAGKLSAGGGNFIALGVDASILLYKWDPALGSDKAIQQTLQAPAYGSSLGHLLLGPVNGDAIPDLISTSNNTIAARYLGSDLSGGHALLDIAPRHLTTSAPPFSPAVAVTRADGAVAIVTIDQEGTAFEWLPTSADNKMNRINDVPVPTGFTPAGNITGDGKLSMVVWNEKTFTLSVVTLPIDLATASPAPALTAAVNYARDGTWGQEWAARLQDRLATATATLQQARTTLEQDPDDTESPTDSLSILAGLDPQDPAAVKFRKAHSDSPLISTGGIAVVAVLLATAGFLFWKMRRRR